MIPFSNHHKFDPDATSPKIIILSPSRVILCQIRKICKIIIKIIFIFVFYQQFVSRRMSKCNVIYIFKKIEKCSIKQFLPFDSPCYNFGVESLLLCVSVKMASGLKGLNVMWRDYQNELESYGSSKSSAHYTTNKVKKEKKSIMHNIWRAESESRNRDFKLI